VNELARSQRSALASNFRTLVAGVALLALLMTSGCVGVTGKATPSVTGISLDVAPNSVSFGNVAVGQSATQTVTLTNNGTEMLTVSGISVSGTGFTASGPQLPLALNPGQSASISAGFKPTVGSTENGLIKITCNAPGSPMQVALSGTGAVAGALTATPASISFGSVAVGSQTTQTLQLANTGNQSATISNVAWSGTGISVSGFTAPLTLAAGKTADLTITYKPVSSGTLAGTVSVSSNAANPSLVINLSGTATSSTLTSTPSSVSFGNVAVGQSATQTVTLTNHGTVTLTVSGISVAGAGFTASGPKLPIALSVGQSITVSAIFKPTVGNQDTGTITITSNASDSPSLVPLSGTGLTAAALTASPAAIAFGNVAVGSQATQTLQLSNTGNQSATISNVTWSGTGVGVSGFTAPLTLAAGQAAKLTVTYKPVSSATLAGTVSISSNATDPTMVIALSATATSSTLAATPSSVSFGNVIVGSNTSQTVLLTNIGTSQVTISSVTPSVAGVAVSGITTPVSLAPGTSATFTAAYKPTGTGNITGTITVASNAVGSPTIINLSATAAAASVQLTPSATSLSFGSVTVGSSGTKQLTVSSTGNANATVSSVTVTGSGFSLTSSAASLVLGPSQAQTYTVNFDPTAPGSPTGTLTIASNAPNSPLTIALSGTAVAAASQHTVTLTWSPSSSTVTGYFVYRGSKSGGPYAQLNSTADANPSYSDNTVADGQVYYYVVTAVDSGNIQSADSNQVSVTIPAN